jgi:hypothetical protein
MMAFDVAHQRVVDAPGRQLHLADVDAQHQVEDCLSVLAALRIVRAAERTVV